MERTSEIDTGRVKEAVASNQKKKNSLEKQASSPKP